MIYILVTIKIDPDAYPIVAKAAIPLMEATQKEDGCHRYELSRSIAKPDELVMVEQWESMDHLKPHFDTPHVKAWREAIGQYVKGRSGTIIHPDRVEPL